MVLSHQMCAGNSTLVPEESKRAWWLSRLSILSSLLRSMSLGVEIQDCVHFLPWNATLHHLLVSSLSAEKSVTNSCFCSFDDCVLLSSGFSLAFCMLPAWVCVLQWPSVFFTPTAGSVSSGHFLASTVSPLSAPGILVIHTAGPSVCVCVSSTLPPSSIGQPECSLRTYSPVHEFSSLLRLTCCQACLQILHFCHYASHLWHILRLFSQDVSSLVKFFLFVRVNVTKSVDITL